MMWKERGGDGKKLVTYQDFERLYVEIVNGRALGGAGDGNKSKHSDIRGAAEGVVEGLHRIYLRQDYNATFDSAKFIAKFEGHKDKHMTVKMAKILSELAQSSPALFKSVLGGLHGLDIGDNTNEKNMVDMVFVGLGDDYVIIGFITGKRLQCVVAGSAEAIDKGIAKARGEMAGDAVMNKILDYIEENLEAKRQTDRLKRASDKVQEGLEGDAAKIIEQLKRER